MTESSNKHSSGPHNRETSQRDSRDRDRAREQATDKKQKGLESQKEAAITQPQSPGEPAGGE